MQDHSLSSEHSTTHPSVPGQLLTVNLQRSWNHFATYCVRKVRELFLHEHHQQRLRVQIWKTFQQCRLLYQRPHQCTPRPCHPAFVLKLINQLHAKPAIDHRAAIDNRDLHILPMTILHSAVSPGPSDLVAQLGQRSHRQNAVAKATIIRCREQRFCAMFDAQAGCCTLS